MGYQPVSRFMPSLMAFSASSSPVTLRSLSIAMVLSPWLSELSCAIAMDENVPKRNSVLSNSVQRLKLSIPSPLINVFPIWERNLSGRMWFGGPHIKHGYFTTTHGNDQIETLVGYGFCF